MVTSEHDESAPSNTEGRFVTLRDIARMAEVSISTVSRALAGTGLVNKRTESRVLRIADEMGYRPNALARSLATRSSRLVGLMVNNMVNASFQRLAEISQARFAAAGYQMLLCITGDDPGQEAAYLSTLFDHRIEGLLVLPTGANSDLIERFIAANSAVVGLVRSHGHENYDSVLFDDAFGAYDGTRQLLELGHRRIGIVVGRQDTNSGRERLAGYKRALTERGIAIRPEYVHSGPFRPEFGISATEAIMSLPEPPTALFSANHEASLGVIGQLATKGIVIPDQLSLLCYEDVPWFSWQKPAISVVDADAEALATLAVDLLLQRIATGAGSRTGRVLRVGARIIMRDSCTPVSPIG